MGNRFGWLIGALLVIAMLGIVGVYTYNMGVAQGVAQSARIAAAPAEGTAPVAPVMMYRPWGFGFFPFFFPFFSVFPLLFFLFFIFALRGLCWRGRWRGRGYYGGGVPPIFEEWHRRMHEQQGSTPAAGTKA